MAGQRPKSPYPTPSPQQPRRRSAQKALRKPSALSTRPVRHRQAKILPTIETDNVPVDCESEFEDPTNAPEPSSSETPSQQTEEPATDQVRESISVLGAFHNGGLQAVSPLLVDALASDGSEYHPSEGEETPSDTENVGHSRKRSKNNNGTSHDRTNTSSSGEKYDVGKDSSGRTEENGTAVPRPQGDSSLVREYYRVEGQRPAKRSRDGVTRQSHHPSKGSIDYRATNTTTQDAGEGSSKSGGIQGEVSAHTLYTRTGAALPAGPPRGEIPQVNLVQRSKAPVVTEVNRPPKHRTSPSTADHHAKIGNNLPSPELRNYVVSFDSGMLPPATDMKRFKLVDCRNERNGLNGGFSKGKGLESDASQKCKACFKFRRNCDQAKSACGHCMRGNVRCISRPNQGPNRQPVLNQPVVNQPIINQPLIPDFSGSQVWEKCQRCAALGHQCSLDEGEDDCQNCKKRGWKCLPQTGPKPKKKYAYRGRFQDPNTKCLACAKARSHCDGAKPKCERCAKWGYACYPPGSEPRKIIPKDEKCKRCRQLKLACSDTLPCPRCVKEGIECGMTANEERKQQRFFGEQS